MHGLTIEPSGDGAFNVYSHSIYGRESVIAGQQRRQFVARYDTVAEAQADKPDATVIEGTTKPWRSGNESLAELSGLPECPPAWFDPADAGETW